MHRPHQTLNLILAVILLSTSLQSGCHSPVVKEAGIQGAKNVRELVKREFAKSIPLVLHNSARNKQILSAAYSRTADSFYLHGSSTSIDDLRRLSLQSVTQVTRLQEITLTASQRNEISDVIVNFLFKKLHKVEAKAYSLAYDNLQQKANNASLTELKKFAFQGASEEAQKQGIKLNNTQIQRIASEQVLKAWQNHHRNSKDQASDATIS